MTAYELKSIAILNVGGMGWGWGERGGLILGVFCGVLLKMKQLIG